MPAPIEAAELERAQAHAESVLFRYLRAQPQPPTPGPKWTAPAGATADSANDWRNRADGGR
jgi:hypothetical protein